jgi:drug/metabolite transporter (DMT)-like permease
MFPAFLTPIFFSFAVIFASRSARQLGGTSANFARMAVALVLLALWAHTFGLGLAGKSLGYFLLSGVVGFGLGDIALYVALPRIGPRLAVLLVHCLAAPIAALVERHWLGTTLRGVEMFFGAIILAGVVIALAPEPHLNLTRRNFWTGTAFGVVAACGQGLGAVLTRKANQIALLNHLPIDALTAAYQRMLGGIVIAAFFFLIVKISHRSFSLRLPENSRALGFNIFLNAFFGPVLGVGCYQWALATKASGIVLPIVATTPVVTIPIAWLLEGDRPGKRSIIGGIIAVAGVIGLELVS